MALRSLIIDDNSLFVEAARDLLEREGIEVLGIGSTGDEAVELATALRPDVMLVDIELGGESGFDVAQRLAQATDGSRLHVVLISTYEENDLADLVANSPAIGFLSKYDLCAAAIHEVLERAG